MQYFVVIDLGYDGIMIEKLDSKEEALKFFNEYKERNIKEVNLHGHRDVEPSLLIEGTILENYNWDFN